MICFDPTFLQNFADAAQAQVEEIENQEEDHFPEDFEKVTYANGVEDMLRYLITGGGATRELQEILNRLEV